MEPQLDASGALLSAGDLPPLKKLGQGKVRDLYEVDSARLLVVVTDRISAFDVVMLNGVPGKGKVLNQLTAFWLQHLESNGLGIGHHMITDDVRTATLPPKPQPRLPFPFCFPFCPT
jgi:phosphoribosylaminoimidazole-succinocarboxamide synthase